MLYIWDSGDLHTFDQGYRLHIVSLSNLLNRIILPLSLFMMIGAIKARNAGDPTDQHDDPSVKVEDQRDRRVKHSLSVLIHDDFPSMRSPGVAVD